MNMTLDILARAAAGDPFAREEAAPLIWRALEGYFRQSGALPLERFLRLPTGNARREIFLRRRNYWLVVAHSLCDGASSWKKAVHLASEVERFQAVLWPTWRCYESPPEGCSDLRMAIFCAMQAAGQIQTDKGAPAMPSTARMLQNIVKPKPDDISQVGGEDEGSQTT